MEAMAETLYEETGHSIEVTEQHSQQVSVKSDNLSEDLSLLLYDIPVSILHPADGDSLKRLQDDYGIKCPLSNATITSNTCDHSGGILMTEDGIKLTIPKGAIKDGDLVKICTAVGLYGPFMLPSKCPTGLVSPFYWIGISSSYHFQKPVKVELEHFAVVDSCKDPSHYQLLTCEDDDESYNMQPIEYPLEFEVKGIIPLCTFHTHHFCSFCLYHKSEHDLVTNRIGAFYLKPDNFQFLDHYTVEIWFSFLHSYCLKRNKELYKKNGKVLDTICNCIFEVFSDKSSTSCFTLDYEKSFNGWCVDHFRCTEIQTKDVNFCNNYTNIEQLKETEESCLFPPRFILTAVKKPKCDETLNTNITVTLYKKEKERLIEQQPVRFKLFIPISTTVVDSTHTNIGKDDPIYYDDHCVSATEAHPMQYDHPSEQEDSVYVYGYRVIQKSEPKIDDDYAYACHNTNPPKGKKPLHSIKDHHCQNNKPELADLTNYSAKISHHWEEIALKLNIPQPDINTIDIDHQHKVQKKCNAMFSKWLDKTIKPCWCNFIRALYDVGLDSVAEEAKQHITKSPFVAPTFKNTPPSDEHNLIDIRELVRFLKDIPEDNKKYFIKSLLPKQSAICVIKDIRCNGGSTRDNTQKICKAFLEEDPSWSKVYQALKEAECDDLADYIEAFFLPL